MFRPFWGPGSLPKQFFWDDLGWIKLINDTQNVPATAALYHTSPFPLIHDPSLTQEFDKQNTLVNHKIAIKRKTMTETAFWFVVSTHLKNIKSSQMNIWNHHLAFGWTFGGFSSMSFFHSFWNDSWELDTTCSSSPSVTVTSHPGGFQTSNNPGPRGVWWLERGGGCARSVEHPRTSGVAAWCWTTVDSFVMYWIRGHLKPVTSTTHHQKGAKDGWV